MLCYRVIWHLGDKVALQDLLEPPTLGSTTARRFFFFLEYAYMPGGYVFLVSTEGASVAKRLGQQSLCRNGFLGFVPR